MNLENILDRLKNVQIELRSLLLEIGHKHVGTIEEALDLLDYLFWLHIAAADLWNDLAEVERIRARDLTQFPGGEEDWELFAAVLALRAVNIFMSSSPGLPNVDRRRELSLSLVNLHTALVGLAEGGSPAAILRARKKSKGRRPDVSSILSVKGVLAELMYVKQQEGMSRKDAAKWIAANISSLLATRISKKPITPRMVEEWLDRFGGKHAPPNAAREAYKIWANPSDPPLTKQRFRQITERIAKSGY